MYHCFAMVTRSPSARHPEDPVDHVEEKRVHHPEEHSEDEHREDHHGGRPLDLLAGRPGRPLQLPLHLGQEVPDLAPPVHVAPREYEPRARTLAGQEGFEPPTSGFGDRRSSRSSYWPAAPRARPAADPATSSPCAECAPGTTGRTS